MINQSTGTQRKEVKMAKKQKQDNTIENFSFFNPELISITMIKFEDDDEIIYNATIDLHLELELDENEEPTGTNKLISIGTFVMGDNLEECILDAYEHINGLFDLVPIYPAIAIYDNFGDFIEEILLEEILLKHGLMQDQPIFH